jgi:hypothetical protein
MTGGGWIPLDSLLCNNPKGTFGFVGGLNAKGEFFGSANYIDHCTGDHAKGDDVIAYCYTSGSCPPDPALDTCRRIVYTGRYNHVPASRLSSTFATTASRAEATRSPSQ